MALLTILRPAGWVFESGGKWRIESDPLMLRKRAKLAGVPRLSPTISAVPFAGDLLNAGADIVTLQKMAGHANPATISCYDRRGKRAQHKAVSLMHTPIRKWA